MSRGKRNVFGFCYQHNIIGVSLELSACQHVRPNDLVWVQNHRPFDKRLYLGEIETFWKSSKSLRSWKTEYEALSIFSFCKCRFHEVRKWDVPDGHLLLEGIRSAFANDHLLLETILETDMSSIYKQFRWDREVFKQLKKPDYVHYTKKVWRTIQWELQNKSRDYLFFD